MTFFNPLLLFTLFTLSIPIIIHLLNFSKKKKIEFSSLMLLKELQEKKLRRIEFKHLILLFLRVLAMTFIILAFAEPFISGYGSGKNIKYNCIILLDDSFSMSASDKNGIYFNNAKQVIEQIKNHYKESDIVNIIPNSEIEKRDIERNFSKYLIKDTLYNLSTSYVKFDIQKSLQFINNNYIKDNEYYNEIFIISDFQKIDFGQSKNLKINEKSTIYLLPLSFRKISNISIDTVIISPQLITQTSKIKLKVEIKNHNNTEIFNRKIKLTLNNNYSDEKVFDINKYENKFVEFDFDLNSSIYSGFVNLSEDDKSMDEIDSDNKYYFSFNIPSDLKICIISDRPENTNYIEKVLSASNSLYSGANLFTTIDNKSVIDESINKFNSLVLISKFKLSESEIDLLIKFLNSNNGINIFLDNAIDIKSYNKFLSDKLSSISIDRLNKLDNSKDTKFIYADFEHPILNGILKSGIDGPQNDLYEILSIKLSSIFDANTINKSYAFLKLSNNMPFVLDAGINNGRLILFTLSPNLEMSDFPQNNIFAPLILKSILYTCGITNSFCNLTIGVNNTIKFDKVYQIQYDRKYKIPENYQYYDSINRKNFNFSLNRLKYESETEITAINELRDEFKKLTDYENYILIDNKDKVNEEIEKSRKGETFSLQFIVIGILILLFEMLYAKYLQNQS